MKPHTEIIKYDTSQLFTAYYSDGSKRIIKHHDSKTIKEVATRYNIRAKVVHVECQLVK